MTMEDGLIECISATALSDVCGQHKSVLRYLAHHCPDSTGVPLEHESPPRRSQFSTPFLSPPPPPKTQHHSVAPLIDILGGGYGHLLQDLRRRLRDNACVQRTDVCGWSEFAALRKKSVKLSWGAAPLGSRKDAMTITARIVGLCVPTRVDCVLTCVVGGGKQLLWGFERRPWTTTARAARGTV